MLKNKYVFATEHTFKHRIFVEDTNTNKRQLFNAWRSLSEHDVFKTLIPPFANMPVPSGGGYAKRRKLQHKKHVHGT